MVEQRSPKPLVACSNRVSPAKQKSRGCMASGLFVCATHGTSLDGESPLWGYVATNH